MGAARLTLRLIADYGAIGGKMVYKPTEEAARQSEPHHQDFGLVGRAADAAVQQFKEHELRRHVSAEQWRSLQRNDFVWASLKNFWCIQGRHLSRQNAVQSSFNRVLGRHESKECRDCGQIHDPPQKCQTTKKHPRRHSNQNPVSDLEKWLAGGRGESKRVFSFKNPRRTFGFVDGCTAWSARGNDEKNDARRCHLKHVAGKSNLALPAELNLDPCFGSLPDASWLGFEVTFTLATPWYSKDDRVFGVPFMAAASWKGLLRWAFRMSARLTGSAWERNEASRRKALAQERHLFGNEKGASEDFERGRRDPRGRARLAKPEVEDALARAHHRLRHAPLRDAAALLCRTVRRRSDCSASP